jgi:hypothetical protein
MDHTLFPLTPARSLWEKERPAARPGHPVRFAWSQTTGRENAGITPRRRFALPQRKNRRVV